MLTLFKNITEEMTTLEKDTRVPLLISVLKQSHEQNRITGSQLCIWFKAQGHDLSGVRLRKMINYIRVKNMVAPAVVIGANNGYFISADTVIIEQQIESIQGRMDAMNAFMDTMKAQLQTLKINKCNAS